VIYLKIYLLKSKIDIVFESILYQDLIVKTERIYQESNLTVKIGDAVHKKVSFIDDLYVYRKNNSEPISK